MHWVSLSGIAGNDHNPTTYINLCRRYQVIQDFFVWVQSSVILVHLGALIILKIFQNEEYLTFKGRKVFFPQLD